MPRQSKSLGKSKGGGAGLHFDKLLKICSNSKSKMPTVSKTAGALGRFGIAQFTSTRNTNVGSGEEEETTSRFSSFSKKRPRLDFQTPLPSYNKPLSSDFNLPSSQDSFRYNPVVPNSYSLSSSPATPTTPQIIKPRKFFKSRGGPQIDDTSDEQKSNLLSSQNFNTDSKNYDIQKNKKSQNKIKKDSSKTLRNATNVNPTTPPTNTPIKLRIFKDKATSKFVCDADTQPSAQDNYNPNISNKKPRGRPRKNQTDSAILPSSEIILPIITKKEKKEAPPPPLSSNQARPKRLTRNSRKHQNRESAEMPILSAASEYQHEHHEQHENMHELPIQQDTHTQLLHEFYESKSPILNIPCPNKSADEIVEKFQDDAEFKQISDMLSSMEESTSNTSQSQPPTLEENIMNDIPPQQQQHHHHHQQQQHHIPHVPHIPQIMSPPLFPMNPPDKPIMSKTQDIRSILEDDWDESFDEESPKKHIVNPSRFDMSIFRNESITTNPNSAQDLYSHQSHQQQQIHQQPPEAHHQHHHQQQNFESPTDLSYNSQYSHHQHQSLMHIEEQQQQQQQPFQPFNAPYAVRNLLNYQNFTQPQDFSQGSSSSMSTSVNNDRDKLGFKQPSIESIEEEDDKLKDIQEEEDCYSNEKEIIDNQLSSVINTQQNFITSVNTNVNVNTNVSSPKKGSIFKSRFQSSNNHINSGNTQAIPNSKKRLALYKHKFAGQEQEEEETKLANEQKKKIYSDEGDFYDQDFGSPENEALELRRLRINVGESGYGMTAESSKVTCKKESKGLFTVVQNVKAMHELQESGEFHEFDGDVWYILEDLKDKNPMASRCLAAITLAMRCMEPAFRMHLRAHGTVGEFSRELHDAPNNPTLALLAATVLFVLSQDRLNMDLDTSSLQLIIAISKTDESIQIVPENLEIAKLRQRVIDLCSEMKNRGHAKHLKLENITASELAQETLLYLTSKRAGEWVKHELRCLGGLDHIVNEVGNSLNWLKTELLSQVWTEKIIDKLWKVDRCLRVLQQVTFNHEENQKYLLGFPQDSEIKESPMIFIDIFRFCIENLDNLTIADKPAEVIREILFSAIRVLVNLSHDYRAIVLGSEILTSIKGFVQLTLHSIFHLWMKFPFEKIFDLMMHSLCMLLNLVEHSRKNRELILSSTIPKYYKRINELENEEDYSSNEDQQRSLEALVQMFLARESAAKTDEENTDVILTKGTDNSQSQDSATSSGASQGDSQKSCSQESEPSSSVQDTIDKLLQTAGKHMENSLIAAYVALLLAYLIMDNENAAKELRNSLPGQRYLPLMIFLKKLFNFMSITSSASGSTRGLKATAVALKFYEKQDPESKALLMKIIPD